MEEQLKRLFVDMDGTLAVFRQIDTLELLYEEGYFRDLEPQETVLNAIKLLLDPNPDMEIFILSSYLSDSAYALKEKHEWLDQYLPEIDREHRIFCPCGSRKADFIPGGIRESDVLFDDYTLNLNDWEPPAIGVKCLNGINHTHGSWQGSRCNIFADESELAKKLYEICLYGAVVHDRLPGRSL